MVGLGVYECRTKNSVFRVIARGITKLRDFPLALQNWYAGWQFPTAWRPSTLQMQRSITSSARLIKFARGKRLAGQDAFPLLRLCWRGKQQTPADGLLCEFVK